MARDAPDNAHETISAAQIAFYAKQAGFQGKDLTNAVAVALAESGGKLDAIGNNGTSRDYGLWQINDKYHADMITADAQWWSPPLNAQMAFKIYSQAGNSFSPWSTFKNGAYLTHVPTAMLAAANPDEVGVVQAGDNTIIEHNPIADLVAPFRSVAGFVFKAGTWMANPKNWGRVAMVGLGGALVVGALAVVAKPAVMGAAAPILNTAADVVPGAGAVRKVAKVAGKVAG